jgi:hypothetical protein
LTAAAPLVGELAERPICLVFLTEPGAVTHQRATARMAAGSRRRAGHGQ